MQIEVDYRQGRIEKTVDEAHCALQAIPRLRTPLPQSAITSGFPGLIGIK